jgi:poly(A) polymerase
VGIDSDRWGWPRHNGAMSLPEPIAARVAPYLADGSPVRVLADRFRAAGHELYLVGGPVRDLILGRESGDVDLTTGARPEAIEGLVRGWADAIWLQGQAFGTIGCQKDGVRFEITTFRAEVYHPDSRKPVVQFGDDLEVDLSRRDFTVNAMALRLPDAELHDPFGGTADLAAGVLRTPLSPEISFTDDPLRMLRAARFASTLLLTPTPEVVEAINHHRERLRIVSAERIRDELDKLLLAPDPSPGLWLIVRTGLADEFLPELTAMELEQDPIHRHKDVLTHTIAVVCNTRPELLVRVAALMHDIAKPRTRSFGPNGVMFHHHEVVGARMTRKRMQALRYPNEFTEDVVQLVMLHLRMHTYQMGWTDSAVRRYVRDAGHLLEPLNHLVRCDCTTRNPNKVKMLSRRMDELETRIEELGRQEELSAIRPDLDGHQVMAFLGVGPGRVVGQALEFLLELRLDEGPLGEDVAFERLASWAADQDVEVAGVRTPSERSSRL